VLTTRPLASSVICYHEGPLRPQSLPDRYNRPGLAAALNERSFWSQESPCIGRCWQPGAGPAATSWRRPRLL